MGERPVDLTTIALAGVADVHGNSTENLVVKASRDEWADDPATPGPELMHHEDIVVSSEVQPNERYGLLWKADGAIGGGPAHPPIAMHRAIQSFPDTHHRRVTYTPRGSRHGLFTLITHHREVSAGFGAPGESGIWER